MEWLERLNSSIEYIERNLTEEIDYNQAARLAGCSVFHYQRMFSYMANIPLSEYIRRRRMTLAAFELQSSDIKIIELALKFSYDSPTSFNRAFQAVHGVAPSIAREEGILLKAYPRISFKISIKGDAEMNYKILQKEAFRIVGVKEHMELDTEKNMARVPQIWAETFQNGTFGKICALENKEPSGILGVSTCMNGKELDYYIACASDQSVPEGMSEYIVPAATWAIFECIGPMPQALQELQTRIVSEWLPTSGYEYADAPDIELYPAGDTLSPNYRCEAWLPVIKN